MKLRIAVTGSRGQIAQSLAERAQEKDVEIIKLSRPQFDLTEAVTIGSALKSAAPGVIVNAAAYTAVDTAEEEEALAHRVNGIGAGMVADVASCLGVPIIHLSTDYVFDGTLDRPYREDDFTGSPLNVYGRSKLAGEQAVKAKNRRHVILRTSWVYSPFGVNFVKTMLRLGESQDTVRVVSDQIGQPTNAFDLADAILNICHMVKNRSEDDRLFGTFHLAGSSTTSWADFAEMIFAEAIQYGRGPVSVTHIASREYSAPARRPANSRLDIRKFAGVYGIVLPPWQSSLPPIIKRLLGDPPSRA